MERRSDVRAALRSLLAPSAQPESGPLNPGGPHAGGREAIQGPEGALLRISNPRGVVLKDIQTELATYGIGAELHEIAQALFDAMADRPALCRSLLASYLLEV